MRDEGGFLSDATWSLNCRALQEQETKISLTHVHSDFERNPVIHNAGPCRARCRDQPKPSVYALFMTCPSSYAKSKKTQRPAQALCLCTVNDMPKYCYVYPKQLCEIQAAMLDPSSYAEPKQRWETRAQTIVALSGVRVQLP
eukprot:1159650-Pelagomonas_calceolata.AAC.12